MIAHCVSIIAVPKASLQHLLKDRLAVRGIQLIEVNVGRKVRLEAHQCWSAEVVVVTVAEVEASEMVDVFEHIELVVVAVVLKVLVVETAFRDFGREEVALFVWLARAPRSFST